MKKFGSYHLKKIDKSIIFDKSIVDKSSIEREETDGNEQPVVSAKSH